MSVKIDYTTSTSAQEAYDKVKSAITPEYAQKFQVKADVVYDDENKIIKSTGPGFTLTLSFHGNHCNANLDLSIILRALKSKIMAKVEEQVRKNI